MKKTFKIIGIVVAALLILILLFLASYLIALTATDYRPEDIVAIDVEGEASKGNLEVGKSYSAMSYNIGFGAYSPEFSFFMDGGEESRAKDKAEVEKNIKGALATIGSVSPDFTLLQEVDIESTRSYKVNQYDYFKQNIGGNYTFAANFDVEYILYPFNSPHGEVLAGQATFSDYAMSRADRYSLPVDDAWPYRLFALDRCMSVNYFDTDNGKQLVLVNIHMSAYDKGGEYRKQQLAMLKEFMQEEYSKGNYVIVGGDYNNELPGTTHTDFPATDEIPYWAQSIPEEYHSIEGFKWGVDPTKPTCRDAMTPYSAGATFVCVLDGFIVSDNITLDKVETVSTGFANSDHQPVTIDFTLN